MKFALLVLIFVRVNETSEKLKKLFEWGPGEIKYTLKNPEAMKYLLDTGKYVPKNNVPLGMAVHPSGQKMFITVPRWKEGVLSTLNWCHIGSGDLKESLHPYPDWAANDIYNDDNSPYKIYSVIRVFVDACDRLWVMDNGWDDKCGDKKQLGVPKILVFDIRTDVLVHMYGFDASIASSDSSFGKIVVDVTPGQCGNAFAYITDVRHAGLVVYDLHKDRAFRIEHNYLKLEPLKSFFYVEGKKKFSLNNVDGICLSGLYKDGYRNLYVSAHTSNVQFITTTRFLREESYRNETDIFFYLGKRCSNCQSGGAQVVHEPTGVMFYVELNNDAISCWNGDHDNFGPSTQERVVVSPELDYVSDMVVTRDDGFAAISCQLHKFLTSDGGVTTRVFVGDVHSLVDGSVCRPKCDCKKKKNCPCFK